MAAQPEHSGHRAAAAARVARRSDGFTLVEVLVATLVLTVGIIAMFSNFSSSQKLGNSAEAHQAAVAVADGELERLRGLKWTELGLEESKIPARSTELTTASPAYWEVSPATTTCPGQGPSAQQTNCYEWSQEATVREPIVILKAESTKEESDPKTATTTATLGGSATRLTFQVYRFVTWVSDKQGCTASKCEGEGDDKRLVVAVTGSNLDKPLYLSSVLSDREVGSSDPVKGLKCEEEVGKTIKDVECVTQK
jgi:Tfp pilus assembly protein PilV